MDLRFLKSPLFLEDKDRTFLINLKTKLSLANVRELESSEAFPELVSFLANFPINIYFCQFEDILFEVLKIIFYSPSKIIQSFIFRLLIDQFQRTLGELSGNHIHPTKIIDVGVCEKIPSFVENSFPQLIIYDNPQNQKLSSCNILELLLKTELIFFKNGNDFMVSAKVRELVQTIAESECGNQELLQKVLCN